MSRKRKPADRRQTRATETGTAVAPPPDRALTGILAGMVGSTGLILTVAPAPTSYWLAGGALAYGLPMILWTAGRRGAAMIDATAPNE